MTKKQASGKPVAHKTTPMPKEIDQAKPATMQAIADEVAKTYQGKVLRFDVRGDVLVILFVDGRKHYLKLDQ